MSNIFNSPIKKETHKGNARIVETENNDKFVIKKKTKSIEHIYSYLKTRDFNNFVEPIKIEKEYEIFPFIEEELTEKNQKALDIIYLMSLLHNKTTFYKEINLDEIKEMYEMYKSDLTHIDQYYNNLNYIIMKNEFMSPSEYLYIRNSSFIFRNINIINNLTDKWYEIMKTKKRQRNCLIHGNIDINNYLNKESGYLISWHKSKFDLPIKDFHNLFKINPKLDYYSLLDTYLNKYKLLEEEILNLFILMLMPNKLVITNDEMKNIENINSILLYVEKSYNLYLEYGKKQ